MLQVYQKSDDQDKVLLAQQNVLGAAHVARRLLELLIEDKNMIEEMVESAGILKSTEAGKVWKTYALVYSADFLSQVIKKLHGKHTA